MTRFWLAVVAFAIFGGCSNQPSGSSIQSAPVTIAVVGTNDVHGQLIPGVERGGLTTLSGYINALRSSGETDAVLLIDAGDMWQGTLESNLDEGASVVQAYNAIGYAASAIGNHEFDFGPAGPAVVPGDESDDPRGALKQRAAELDFPLLAANIVDSRTGQLPDWDNFHSSVLIDVAGIKVGIIGLLTIEGLHTTIAANVAGLELLPLAETARHEAEQLRERGAQLVIVTAHAGGRCSDFEDPSNFATCEQESEIMRLAADLPSGLVDHIIGGHVDDGVAHIAHGISITASYSRTKAFGRTDFTIDPGTGQILHRRVYPPQVPCPYMTVDAGQCAWAPDPPNTRTASYAGQPVIPDATVLAIARDAVERTEQLKNKKLGVVLAQPFTLKGHPNSPLGNLVLQAIQESADGDFVIFNVNGGLRAPLPAGELTYGSVYEMFPFDNRNVVVDLSGRELRDVIAAQVRLGHQRRVAGTGLLVSATCRDNVVEVELVWPDGAPVRDADRVRVIINDFLAMGGGQVMSPATPDSGYPVNSGEPLVRDMLVNWFSAQERLHPEAYSQPGPPAWQVDSNCYR